jgi:DNA-binding Xre family transcriptional regulator
MYNSYQVMMSPAMEKLTKRLSKRLKSLRGEQTLRGFARKLGIHAGSLNRLEQGQQNVTVKTLQKLCDRLKCDIGDLFKEDDP